MTSAVERVEPRVIEFGRLASNAWLLDGWAGRGPDLGRADGVASEARWGTGAESAVRVWLAERRPLILELAARPSPESMPLAVTVSLNGKMLDTLELRPGLASYRIAVRKELEIAGDNVLRLRYRSHGQGDQHDRRALAVQWHRLRLLESAASDSTSEPSPSSNPEPRAAEDGLHLPWRSGIEIFFLAPHGAMVKLEGVRVAAGATEPERARLAVRTRTEKGARVEEDVRVGHDKTVRLPPSGGPVGLSLTAIGSEGGGELIVGGVTLRVFDAAVSADESSASSDAGKRRSSAAADSVAGPVADRSGPPSSAVVASRPNVVFYLVDTLRADHLGAYGYQRPTSPELHAFAADATLFTEAIAASSWTRPSTATVLTGYDPRVHGAQGRRDRLDEAITTLPERLQAAGYQTMAVVTNSNVSGTFGFYQGFDDFTYLRGWRHGVLRNRSDRVTDRALRWLEKERDPERPFFVYLHTADPHAPYNPPQAERVRFARHRGAGEDGGLPQLTALQRGELEPTPELRDRLVDLYDAEIAFNDRQFGRLLAGLRRLGLYQNTLIVFLSDHGEEFGEHRGWQHGRTLFQEQLHVPLVVRLPHGAGSGQQLAGFARHVDLVPTVLDLLGLQPPSDVPLQGESLLPVILGEAPAPSFAIAHLHLDNVLMEAYLGDRYKLLRTFGRGDKQVPAERLFDLDSDGTERTDLALSAQVWTGFLTSQLRAITQRWPPSFSATEAEISPELEADLRALGYVE